MMKNIQVIDGANNCTYPIYSVTEEEFLILFPKPNQNVEFIEDLVSRVGEPDLGDIMRKIWKRKINKIDAIGVHGTLYYEMLWKKKYFPTKIEKEMVWAPPNID